MAAEYQLKKLLKISIPTCNYLKLEHKLVTIKGQTSLTFMDLNVFSISTNLFRIYLQFVIHVYDYL